MALDSIVELVALGVRAGERRRRELDGIQETSAALLRVLDLQEVLSIIVARAAQVFDVPATSVMLWDRMKANMVVRDSWGLPHAYKENHRLPSSLVQSLAMPAGQFRTLTAEALREHPTGDENLIEQQGLVEILRAPFTMAGQLTGYLSIYDRDAHRPVTPEEIELTGIFAGQAGVGRASSRTLRSHQRRNQHWQALHEASKAIAEGFAGDRKAILDRIIEQAVEEHLRRTRAEGQLRRDPAARSSHHGVDLRERISVRSAATLKDESGRTQSHRRQGGSIDRIGITGRTALPDKPSGSTPSPRTPTTWGSTPRRSPNWRAADRR